MVHIRIGIVATVVLNSMKRRVGGCRAITAVCLIKNTSKRRAAEGLFEARKERAGSLHLTIC